MSTPCFLATEIGMRAWLRIFWRTPTDAHLHNALKLLGDTLTVNDRTWAGGPSDYPDPAAWPTACTDCGAAVPTGHFLNQHHDDSAVPVYQVFTLRLYDANGQRYVESGRGMPEALPAGAMFWTTWHDATPCWEWDNCDGRHLQIVLPNGRLWDIDGRASNCTMPEDRLHRCWVRHGTPPQVTVDKVGRTCAAGAGSIQAGSYHGFLRAGVLT